MNPHELNIELLQGDCLDVMATLDAESIDAIVTDPPYGIGFLGRDWDSVVPGLDWAQACLRVLKPGGHLVAFGGCRTVHRLACSIEDAGFEIRDLLAWAQWQGFPKSMDISKAIDAAAGVEREVVGRGTSGRTAILGGTDGSIGHDITAPATPEAKAWEGFGTALKPAFEPAVIARKPIAGTVAANVLRYGTGALNIDGCRIKPGDPAWPGPGEEVPVISDPGRRPGGFVATGAARGSGTPNGSGHPLGRWPANVYQCPKPSRSEREAGCAHLPARAGFEAVERSEGSAGVDNPRAGAGRTASRVRNHHPTVKPLGVIRWIVRLVGGRPGESVILDPFMGSGTTLAACAIEGFAGIGIEREAEYIDIAEARIKHEIGGLFAYRVRREGAV